jgi:hypothetical protein
MDTDSTETHQRLEFVLDQILNTVPAEMRDHPMAKMLSVFCREGKKDIRRIPGPFIESLSRQIGEAFAWVADGSMSDLPSEPDISEVTDNGS